MWQHDDGPKVTGWAETIGLRLTMACVRILINHYFSSQDVTLRTCWEGLYLPCLDRET